MSADVDDQLWAAVTDPSRLRILDLLVVHGKVSASWLSERVPISRQAVSKHLVALVSAGLVSRRRQGREVLYLVDADRLNRTTQAMADRAAFWNRRIRRIKELAESESKPESASAGTPDNPEVSKERTES